MHIEEHPFYILGVTQRSTRRDILQAADALSIHSDPERISALRVQLTHPAKRLEAEVTWFPGLAPSKIRQITESIRQDSDLLADVEKKLSGVGAIGVFNALAYWVSARENLSPADWGLALHQLNYSLWQIDTDELTTTLNADRSAAGMPPIRDASVIENALAHLEESAAACLAERLVRCHQHSEVLMLIVEHETQNGEGQASDFIGRLVERHQILIQPELQQCSTRVFACAERILSIAGASIVQPSTSRKRMAAAVHELKNTLDDWGALARPVQLLMRSRGLKDTNSIEIVKQVRGVALKVANDFDLHEDAQRITKVLYNVFRRVPEIAELLQQDFETLQGIINANKESAGRRDYPQLALNFDEGKRCPECGGRMVEMAGSSGAIFVCTGAGCSRTEVRTAITPPPIAETQNAPVQRDPIDGFAQLCRSIRLNCWQRVKAEAGYEAENLAAFKAAHADYQRQAAPWLGIICDTYRADTSVLMKVRNAAAECLNSIAGGLICANDLDTAQRLCLDALQLVFDNSKIEAEIKGHLGFIASEKEKVKKAPPRPAPTKAESPPDTGRDTAPKDRLGATLAIAAVGIPVLLAVLFKILTAHEPQELPSASNLVVAGPQSARAAASSGESRPSAPQLPHKDSQLERAPETMLELKPMPKAQTPDFSDAARYGVTFSTEEPKPPSRRVTTFSAARTVPLPKGPVFVGDASQFSTKPVPPPSKLAPISAPFAEKASQRPEPARDPVPLANGTNIAPPRDAGGLGKLTISNYTDQDAAVKLKSFAERTTVRFVYVRAMSDVTLTNITSGTYVLQFATGRDWDSTDLRFRQNSGYAAFDEPLSFSERTVEDGTIYSNHSVTLHTVPNGNIRKKTISVEEFSDDRGPSPKS